MQKSLTTSSSASGTVMVGERYRVLLKTLPEKDRRDLEAFVVNRVKVDMIRKLEHLLEEEGRRNLREVFLVPIFTIKDLTNRVSEMAPDIRTFFYKELCSAIGDVEKRFVCSA